MAVVTVKNRYQVVIPRGVRERVGIRDSKIFGRVAVLSPLPQKRCAPFGLVNGERERGHLIYQRRGLMVLLCMRSHGHGGWHAGMIPHGYGRMEVVLAVR